MQTGLYLELFDFLNKIGKIELMQQFMKAAIQLSQSKHDTNIHCLEKFALQFISIGNCYVIKISCLSDFIIF